MALPGLEAPSWQPFWPPGISGNGSTTWSADAAFPRQGVVLVMRPDVATVDAAPAEPAQLHLEQCFQRQSAGR